MPSTSEKLQMLLDGELKPEDIDNDPALVSLADRLYGIKIAPSNPVKARDMVETGGVEVVEVAPPTDMLIEVVAPIAAPAAQPAPLPTPTPGPLPEVAVVPELPAIPEGSVFSGLQKLALLGLVNVIANMLGLFSYIFGDMCDPADICPVDGNTRINLMDIHRIDTGYGWSEPITSGAYGIPDLVALGVLVLMFLVFKKK